MTGPRRPDAVDPRGPRPTTATLVDACLAGAARRSTSIVERHQRQVYQLCYRFVGNHEDASDLAQDVFVRAYRGLQRFKGESALATWLYRIARQRLPEPGRRSRRRRLERSSCGRARRSSRPSAPDAALLRGERAARGARGDRAAAAQAARDADPARLSRAAARADRRDPRQLGRRGEGEFLPRAGEPEEVAGGMNTPDRTPIRRPAPTATLAAVARGASRRVRRVPRAGRRRSARCCADAPTVEVPEPSPLFWDHFSARVSEACASRRPTAAAARFGWARPDVPWAMSRRAADARARVAVSGSRSCRERGPLRRGAAAGAVGADVASTPTRHGSLTVDVDPDTDEAWALVRSGRRRLSLGRCARRRDQRATRAPRSAPSLTLTADGAVELGGCSKRN